MIEEIVHLPAIGATGCSKDQGHISVGQFPYIIKGQMLGTSDHPAVDRDYRKDNRNEQYQ
jgi:hypothetical protein